MSEENKSRSRESVMSFSKAQFARIIFNDLKKSSKGRTFLKSYKQSEVREIIEGYKVDANQKKLREISQLLWAKSPQYQRLLEYFSGMGLFAHVLTPIKDIRKLNKAKVLKQYVELGELLKLMSLRHEMSKVLSIAFREDIYYGYVHRDKKSFQIQQIDSDICKATVIEDGVLNYCIDMSAFQKDSDKLKTMPAEVIAKFSVWMSEKAKNSNIEPWVELDSKNTICIKINEEIPEVFPPFAGSFDSIFDIEGFKQLRKDKEELGNYMMLYQKLPIRENSQDNNDFLIDMDTMSYFHEMAVDTVPDNVGVVTSPMNIEPIKFEKDKADNDGVAKAERDFWSGNGTSQLLFNADSSTSQGLLLSVKTDEEIVLSVMTQIERWLNRYLRYQFKSDLMFNVTILPVTRFNQDTMYKMYLENAQYGVPVKSHLSATVGLDPIEVMNMAYLENDLLEMHEEFIPLQSTHTMSDEANPQAKKDGAPKKDASEVSDETARAQDKPNA
ncbi:hypothetical protein IEN91_04600 [Bacillus velezensis]|uniref:hypothetical protein n=1 Tax=Bacillus velezensis TaxID=492670 RepID=UPI0018C4D59D|nr:hypothetical protein [Bacillus velezensis]QPK89735.1 hypothetical protein IEN91_04600 [Bacillus velezensis]